MLSSVLRNLYAADKKNIVDSLQIDYIYVQNLNFVYFTMNFHDSPSQYLFSLVKNNLSPVFNTLCTVSTSCWQHKMADERDIRISCWPIDEIKQFLGLLENYYKRIKTRRKSKAPAVRCLLCESGIIKGSTGSPPATYALLQQFAW